MVWLVVSTSKSADELQSTEHTKICPLLLHRVAGVACEWLPPFLDLSRTLRDTVKRVKVSDARSCAPRASRGPIVYQRHGFTQETTLISDDAAAILADRCKSRGYLPAKRAGCRPGGISLAAHSSSAMLLLLSARGPLGQRR